MEPFHMLFSMWKFSDLWYEGCGVMCEGVMCEGCDVWGMWCVYQVRCIDTSVNTPEPWLSTLQTSLRMARWQITFVLLPTENNFSRWQIDNQLNACPLPVNMHHGNVGIAPFLMSLGTVALPWIPADKRVQLLSNTAEAMYMQE